MSEMDMNIGRKSELLRSTEKNGEKRKATGPLGLHQQTAATNRI